MGCVVNCEYIYASKKKYQYKYIIYKGRESYSDFV